MANDVNLCQFIGRLGRDPEVKYLPSGVAVANFSIACGSSWKDRNTGEKQERTEWIRLVAFDKLADIVGKYLKKGAKVYVSGKFQTRTYEKDGQKHYATEVVLSNMQMLDKKPEGNEIAEQQAAAAGVNTAAPGKPVDGKPTAAAEDFDDDIPF